MIKIFIRALIKFRILRFLNINGTISLNKKKYKIPIIQGVGLSNLIMSEPWMIDLLEIVLPIENKRFIDVGVNIGQTLLKLKSVSSEIEYIGFEPNPMCVNYVDLLVKNNNFKRISVIPVGISDKTEIGVLNFFYSSSTDSSASMIAEFRPGQKIDRKEFIPLFDLERLKETINLDVVSVLKIDVEGAELEVLSSFKSIIKDKQPIILIEILPAYNDQNLFRVERQNKIQLMLSEAGYSIHRVIKENDILLNLEEISEIGIHSDLNKCEYVMVPDNKKEKFKNYCQQRLKRQ
ncbi:MAG: FkbM family methyltransferase [Flavobacteriaceae bacterium]|nr:FkbM family methyltransferase [Flavobacteriaceae bacterium]